MSLYYDAAAVLTTPPSAGGSFKSRIYNARNLKASPAQIYALVSEAAKWDIVLKEVIDNAGLLNHEPKLTPLLALLLVHDHLLSKKGIAAPANHPLRQAIERHKTRLKAEFVKTRVRRGCASIADLQAAALREKKCSIGDQTDSPDAAVAAAAPAVYPRWVRINNVRTTLDTQLRTTFSAYKQVASLAELTDKTDKRFYIDPHIPDLIAVAFGVDFSTASAYKNGEIILQDKASCFPAYLLAGDSEEPWTGGDLIDGCAAPGNKTTHLASLLYKRNRQSAHSTSKVSPPHIYSMDASKPRAKTLQKMVTLSGADSFTTVLQGQDFLALDPNDPRFRNVTGLLLDPSCSGSGIVGREDVPQLALPVDPRPRPQAGEANRNSNSKKRKRNKLDDDDEGVKPYQMQTETTDDVPTTDENELAGVRLDPDRLTKLSNIQTRIVEHALSFPAATRVTYSTCSTHLIENESVVSRVLASEVARSRGWRLMRRDEQPAGLKAWNHRGVRTENANGRAPSDTHLQHPVNLTDEELRGCIRCWPGDDEGLGGFFVAGFIRDGAGTMNVQQRDVSVAEVDKADEADEDEEEWRGFSD